MPSANRHNNTLKSLCKNFKETRPVNKELHSAVRIGETFYKDHMKLVSSLLLYKYKF